MYQHEATPMTALNRGITCASDPEPMTKKESEGDPPVVALVFTSRQVRGDRGDLVRKESVRYGSTLYQEHRNCHCLAEINIYHRADVGNDVCGICVGDAPETRIHKHM